jgi:hypothetical protein
MDDHELMRIDALCAHVEACGIGEILPYLTPEEFAHIEVSARKFFGRRRGAKAATSFPPLPTWVKSQPYEVQEYLNNIRKRYLVEVRAVAARGGGKAGASRIADIKKRYAAEMKRAYKELERERKRGIRRLPSPRSSGLSHDVPSDLPSFPTAAQIEADFDFWVACL